MAKSAQQAGLLSGIRVVEAASMIMVPAVGAGSELQDPPRIRTADFS
jgi:hypothetical protein